MGIYLNPGAMAYQIAVNSEIFVDKSEMILYLNSLINTSQRYVCVTRPRRFGKTMAVDMLCAYYSREANSRSLFERCKIGNAVTTNNEMSWDVFLGKLDVIRLVMTEFLDDSETVKDMLSYLSEEIIAELQDAYPDVQYGNRLNLRTVMNKIYESKKRQFIIVIDEWYAIFREYKADKVGQKKYLDFLRDWLKDKPYIALAYMTGILPIKKYGKHSALNMFDEYSMTQPMQLVEYVGFISEEVESLCTKHKLNYAGL